MFPISHVYFFAGTWKGAKVCIKAGCGAMAGIPPVSASLLGHI